MDKKQKLVATFAIVSMGAGMGSFGYGTFDSLHARYTNKEGENAVEKCVVNKEKCSLSEYKLAAEFSTRQDRAGSFMLGGLGLSLFSSYMLTSIILSGGVTNRRPRPKKPKKNNGPKS